MGDTEHLCHTVAGTWSPVRHLSMERRSLCVRISAHVGVGVHRVLVGVSTCVPSCVEARGWVGTECFSGDLSTLLFETGSATDPRHRQLREGGWPPVFTCLVMRLKMSTATSAFRGHWGSEVGFILI